MQSAALITPESVKIIFIVNLVGEMQTKWLNNFVRFAFYSGTFECYDVM